MATVFGYGVDLSKLHFADENKVNYSATSNRACLGEMRF